MKKWLIIKTFVLISFGFFAQIKTKVQGSIPVGLQQYTIFLDELNMNTYKSSVHPIGMFNLNEEIFLGPTSQSGIY